MEALNPDGKPGPIGMLVGHEISLECGFEQEALSVVSGSLAWIGPETGLGICTRVTCNKLSGLWRFGQSSRLTRLHSTLVVYHPEFNNPL